MSRIAIQSLTVEQAFNGGYISKKGNEGKVNLEEVKKIMKEKGKVSAMSFLTKENNMTVSGARALVMRVTKLL